MISNTHSTALGVSPLQTTTDPVVQSLLWLWEFIRGPAAPFIAIGLGAVMLWFIGRRFQSDADPSLRKQMETATGTVSILLSGVYVILALAVGITIVTWPAPIETPVIGVALVLGVIVMWAIEKNEQMEEGA